MEKHRKNFVQFHFFLEIPEEFFQHEKCLAVSHVHDKAWKK